MCDDCLKELRDKLKRKIDWYEEQAATLQMFGLDAEILEPAADEEDEPDEPAPVAKAKRSIPVPSTNGHAKIKRVSKYLEPIMKALASGPKSTTELSNILDAQPGSFVPTLKSGPFEKVDPSNRLSPWKMVA